VRLPISPRPQRDGKSNFFFEKIKKIFD